MKPINKECLLALIVMVLFIIGFTFFLAFNDPISVPDYQNDFKSINESLIKERQELTKQIEDLRFFQMYQGRKIDSLENVKKQIKIIYVTKIKEVDSSNATSIVSDFKDIFTKGYNR